MNPDEESIYLHHVQTAALRGAVGRSEPVQTHVRGVAPMTPSLPAWEQRANELQERAATAEVEANTLELEEASFSASRELYQHLMAHRDELTPLWKAELEASEKYPYLQEQTFADAYRTWSEFVPAGLNPTYEDYLLDQSLQAKEAAEERASDAEVFPRDPTDPWTDYRSDEGWTVTGHENEKPATYCVYAAAQDALEKDLEGRITALNDDIAAGHTTGTEQESIASLTQALESVRAQYHGDPIHVRAEGIDFSLEPSDPTWFKDSPGQGQDIGL